MWHEPSYGFSLSVVSTQLGVILLRRFLLYAPAPASLVFQGVSSAVVYEKSKRV